MSLNPIDSGIELFSEIKQRAGLLLPMKSYTLISKTEKIYLFEAQVFCTV